MGPTLIFDKSLLQSLNADEAMWLDQFFLSNVTPLFFIETLADLEKEIRNGKTAEESVGNIAYKTPDFSSRVNAHHLSLIAGELMGHGKIGMDRRPVIYGGQPVRDGNKVGLLFENSLEEQAFERWQKHEFLEVEKLYAKTWRQMLSDINLEDKYLLFQKYFGETKPRNLNEVKVLVDQTINSNNIKDTFLFGLWLVGVPKHIQTEVIARWESIGLPELITFAPYFTYVYSVDLFFYLGIAADLIGRGRASHKIDLAYLYYLPFCHVFTSSDKLHKEIAPFFIKSDQDFIYGPDLKEDLKSIDKYYSELPDLEKARGVSSFAMFPPQDKNFIVCNLWDKYMNKGWRTKNLKPCLYPKNKASEEIMNHIKIMQDKENFLDPSLEIRSDDASCVVIKRRVRNSKGKWNRFPPEITNQRQDENGEWQDA